MSRLAEQTLIRWLPYDDAVNTLSREGLDLEVVPTPDYRPLVQWCLDYYTRSGCGPTVAVLVERWGDLLSDHGFGTDDEHDHRLSDQPEDEPEEPIEWVMDVLKADYVRTVSKKLSIRIGQTMTTVEPEKRVATFGELASEMVAESIRLQPRTSAVDARQGMVDMLADYDRIAASGNPVRGMTLGLPEVDAELLGIWPGELCVLAAPPKQMKSWVANWIALQEWQRERVTVIFTLENGIKMTLLRMACVATGLSITELMNGGLSPEDYDRLKTWVHDEMATSDTPLHVLCPEDGLRNPAAVVAQARAYGADSLIVDQLSHLDAGQHRTGWSRANELAHIVRALKAGISTGRQLLSTLLIHQINREGVKHLEGNGRLLAHHAGDTSEAERSGEPLLGLHSSRDEQACGLANLQVLAARRVRPGLGWQLNMNVDVGRISVSQRLEAA